MRQCERPDYSIVARIVVGGVARGGRWCRTCCSRTHHCRMPAIPSKNRINGPRPRLRRGGTWSDPVWYRNGRFVISQNSTPFPHKPDGDLVRLSVVVRPEAHLEGVVVVNGAQSRATRPRSSPVPVRKVGSPSDLGVVMKPREGARVCTPGDGGGNGGRGKGTS